MKEDKKITDLSNYDNKWVALSAQDTTVVVGSGDTIEDALKEAEGKGEKKPVLKRVPEDYSSFVL